MADFVEEDEPFHPVAIGHFRTAAVVAGTERFAKMIEQLGWPDGIGGFLFRNETYVLILSVNIPPLTQSEIITLIRKVSSVASPKFLG
jgi:hypothetical protein